MTIADIVASDAPAFRCPVGHDAEIVLGARALMVDETFATMRATLELDG